MIDSADTAGHVEKVVADSEFWAQWTGRGEAELGDLGTPRIVSGATLTSEAMARGVAARFGAKGMDEWFTKKIEPATVARWFPKADRIEPDAQGRRVSAFLREETKRVSSCAAAGWVSARAASTACRM